MNPFPLAVHRDHETTDATRYLTEGVYLDPRFRDLVIRQVHNDSYHRVPPSYGFDLVPVVEHAWRGWVLATSLQVCTLAVLAISFTSNAPAAVLVVSCIGLWYTVPLMLRAAYATLRLKSRAIVDKLVRRKRADRDELRRQVRVVLLSTAACLVFAAVPILVAHGVHIPMTEAVPAAGLLLSLISVVCITVGVVRYLAVRRVHRARSLRPTRLTKRLRTINEQQEHAYVVYGQHVKDRFVGSGLRVYSWRPPLVVPLLRPGEGSMVDREHAAAPFQAHQLVDHIRATMASVGDPADPTRLLGFGMRDRLYVPENALTTDRDCLRTEPDWLDIVQAINDPHGFRQHYLEICVDEMRELVITVFVRVAIRGRSLTVDFSACALTATPLRFHALNAHNATSNGAVFLAALHALRDLPKDVATTWRLIEAPWVLGRALWARKDWSLVPRRRVLIGSRPGIREIHSLPWANAYLEKEAVARVIKHIEQRLLVAIEEFLESMDVDTSLLANRVANIINSGVMNFGGDMEINNSAVGEQANVQNAGSGTEGGAGGQTNATAGGS